MDVQFSLEMLIDQLIGENWWAQALVLLQFLVAAILSGVVGLEREFAERPAGFRTHMLVGGAAALLVGLTSPLVLNASTILDTGHVLNADPIRIVEAIVTGVAFLGAGTIFRNRDGGAIEGLTTAASLLLVSGIGIAVAIGQMVTAVGITLLALVILRVIGAIQRRTRDD